MMQSGIVKRFNKIKGYGFISSDLNKQELFVHFSEIQTEGYKELVKGQRVKYIPAEGERGAFATKVEVQF